MDEMAVYCENSKSAESRMNTGLTCILITYMQIEHTLSREVDFNKPLHRAAHII